jgi:hypothetical protein
MKKITMITIACAAMLLVASLVLVASNRNGIIVTQDGRQMIATKGPSHVTPDAEDDSKLVTISGNLSTYQYATFFCCFGYTIAGPDSELGFTSYVALPFTPSKNMTVNKVEVSLGYYTANVPITLSVNNDASGLPGTAIKSWNTKVPDPYGACCTLVTASSSAGVPVTGGTQYWLVMGTGSKNTNFFGGWADNSTDMRAHQIASFCKTTGNQCGSNNGKWALGAVVLPGYAVLGK